MTLNSPLFRIQY